MGFVKSWASLTTGREDRDLENLRVFFFLNSQLDELLNTWHDNSEWGEGYI